MPATTALDILEVSTDVLVYRQKIGWEHGRIPGARTAVGPDIRPLPATGDPS